MTNSPKEVANNYVGIGVGKVKLPIAKMFVLGILAGAFIAFGGVAFTVTPVSITSASVGKLVGAMCFPLGLCMVLIGGAELFTGNNLLVIPLLQKKITVKELMISWIVVYIGNFVGSILIAWLVVYGHAASAFGNGVAENMVNIAMAKNAVTFGDGIMKGILCNILVCMAVWMSFASKTVSGKFIVLYMPITLFVACGFEHSIANMYYMAAGLFASAEYGIEAAMSWGSLLMNNLLPVTIGNMIGGCGIGAAYWYIYLQGNKD